MSPAVPETLPLARSKNRAPLLAAGVTLLLCAAWLVSRGRAAPTGPAGKANTAPAVPVSVATAERRDLPVYLTGLGTITAYNTVTVKSRVDGQIVEVAFREGQEVKQGDLLVVVDPRPFEVQLAQARSSLARSQSQLEDARVNERRDQDLFDQGILPTQQMDSQRALVHQLEAATRVDEAAIDNAKLQLTYCRITAPVSGRVGLRLVDVGNVIRASDQTGLLVITQLEPITVVFTLPEDSLPTVAQHMKGGPLSAEAWSRDDSTKLATGTLLTIDNQIDPTTGTGRLKAVFDNKDRTLWPNQFVNVRLLVEVRKDQTLVPAAAVQRGSTGVFAYVVKPDRTIEVRSLTVGLSQGSVVSIDAGVAPGDQVVTDGHEKVQAGSKVETRSLTASPSASPSAASPRPAT
jgi:membrane fusion protein, multidrug efflux system